MAKRFGSEQWSRWVAEQHRSGLSVREFCRGHQISEQAFYRWRKRLATESPSSAPGQHADNFVPLSVVQTGGVEIGLPCGATVQVSDESSLHHVLKVLLELGATPAKTPS